VAHNLATCVAILGGPKVTIRVCIEGFSDDEASAIKHLLYPYRLQFVGEIGEADLAICSDPHEFSKPTVSVSDKRVPDKRLGLVDHGNQVIDLPYDLIRSSSERFRAIMKPRVALTYKLATRLRFQYNVIPSPIRNALLRTRHLDSNLSSHLVNEQARRALGCAIKTLGFNLERRNPASLIITHDIESEKGLRNALLFKRIEDELQLKSTWFLPSDEYPIPRSVARELAEGSTIGSHDVRHDGRLIHIRKHQALVKRLRTSRLQLERIFDKEVTSFRSPLLQFSENLISGLSNSGYRFDFSVPCWEPVHPVAMSGFGIEAVQGFEIYGVAESPLTLFQDHQVLNVLGMNTGEAIKLWVEQATLVRSLDGDIVVLIHPEYAFSRHLDRYRELLVSLMGYK
jgi:peptidoglycan/xylan/chitin deacetylase (PgdA/CDA1 family)